MRRLIFMATVLSFMLVACSKQERSVNLEEGTAAYEMAKELSAILPAVDPTLNPVLIKTKGFSITAGDVIQTIQSSMGNRASPEALESALQEQYTMAGGEEKFLEVLASNGMDLEFVKTSIESNLIIENYLEGLSGR